MKGAEISLLLGVDAAEMGARSARGQNSAMGSDVRPLSPHLLQLTVSIFIAVVRAELRNSCAVRLATHPLDLQSSVMSDTRFLRCLQLGEVPSPAAHCGLLRRRRPPARPHQGCGQQQEGAKPR